MSEPVKQRFYQSPVDYEAWGKGYTPPSEHVLIDALAYRGARVVSSCSDGGGFAFWIVTQGDVSTKKRSAMRRAMLEWYMDDDDPPAPKAVAGFALLTPEQREAALLYTGADC